MKEACVAVKRNEPHAQLASQQLCGCSKVINGRLDEFLSARGRFDAIDFVAGEGRILLQSVLGRPWRVAFYLFLALIVLPATYAQQQAKHAAFNIEKAIDYGRGNGQLGLVRGADVCLGPESFASNSAGEMFIADLVNQRVLVHSDAGEFLREIPLPGYVVNDVAVDKDGKIYVYDDSRRVIVQIDSSGQILGELAVNPSAIETRGYVHVVNSSIYFANSANKDVLIAEIRNGILVPPETRDIQSDGIHSDTGKIYAVNVDRGTSLKLRVEERGIGDRAIILTIPGILSAAYVGEDRTGRIYIQTERATQDKVALDVTVLDHNCDVLGTIQMPENDYVLWTAKLLSVRSDGSIIQFIPKRDQLKLGIIRDAFGSDETK